MLSHFECEIEKTFLSVATIVAANYGFTCPLRFISVVCLFVVGTDKNCNSSVVRSPIELKLGGDLGLGSQISVHVLVSRFDGFSYCKQTKKQKIAEIAKNEVLENLSFLRCSMSD
jgi:hypothetical protein